MAAILMRFCGKLMHDTPPKVRESLTGTLWKTIKEKDVTLNISHFNSLIRVLNENNTVSDPQKILEEISAAGLEPDRVTYRRLIHQYCIQANSDGAMTLLLKFMSSNSIEPSGVSYAVAVMALVKSLKEDPGAIVDLNKIHDIIEREDKDKDEDKDRNQVIVKPSRACALCSLNLRKLDYTDVMILSQFIKVDGSITPYNESQLCGKQYNRVKKLIEQAQRCNLIKRPPDYFVPGPWHDLNTYLEIDRKRDQPMKIIKKEYWKL